MWSLLRRKQRGPMSTKQDWTDLEMQHKRDTQEWQTVVDEVGPLNPAEPLPTEPEIHRQRLYRDGHACEDCGRPTPAPKCSFCLLKESSNVYHRP